MIEWILKFWNFGIACSMWKCENNFNRYWNFGFA